MKTLIEIMNKAKEKDPNRTQFEDLETIRNAEAIEREQQIRRNY
jgi:hypothetical protein